MQQTVSIKTRRRQSEIHLQILQLTKKLKQKLLKANQKFLFMTSSNGHSMVTNHKKKNIWKLKLCVGIVLQERHKILHTIMLQWQHSQFQSFLTLKHEFT